jgi:hypothetical protein
MNWKTHSTLAAMASAAILAIAPVHAQQNKPDGVDPRPANPEANLPSDTGSQATLPSGAVTGAGQPQGTLPQPAEGKPGGLEERARRDASGDPDAQPSTRRKGDTRSPR